MLSLQALQSLDACRQTVSSTGVAHAHAQTRARTHTCLKAFFALVRDIEFLGREFDGLGGDCAVVRVDEKLFVYGRRIQRALAYT